MRTPPRYCLSPVISPTPRSASSVSLLFTVSRVCDAATLMSPLAATFNSPPARTWLPLIATSLADWMLRLVSDFSSALTACCWLALPLLLLLVMLKAVPLR